MRISLVVNVEITMLVMICKIFLKAALLLQLNICCGKKISRDKNIARIAKAAIHKLPGKLGSNVSKLL